MMSQIEDKRLPWQHLRTISIVNICRMIFKSVQLKLGDFISLSCGVSQLLRKVPKGADPQSKLAQVLCKLSRNVGKRNPLQVAEFAISSCKLAIAPKQSMQLLLKVEPTSTLCSRCKPKTVARQSAKKVP